MIKVGLIGAGGIARPHVEGYRRIPEQVTLAAVADVVAESARTRAERAGGAAVFADYREMLDTAELDAVDICLPHHLHADAIVAAAAAGKHVLCEKPLCLSVAEGERVRSAVADAGVTLMCAHNQLFLPPVAKARELLDAGAIGTPYELRTTDCFPSGATSAEGMGWRAHKETAGGGELIDTGYHPTYLLLYLAGAEPTEVAAMTATHKLKFSEGEDSAQVLVRFANGMVGSIVTSWAYQLPATTERFSVVGEKGSLWSDGKTLWQREINGEAVATEFDEVDGFAAEIADFVACLRDGRRPVNNQDDGIAVLKVILGAYASVEQGRIVTLADL